jgi:hypothetical protein
VSGRDRLEAARQQAANLAIAEEEEQLSVPSVQLNFLLTGLLPTGTEIEEHELPSTCEGFLGAQKWRKVLELATFDSFDTLPEEIERQPEVWKEWIEGQGPEQDEAPSPYSEGECSQFAAILLRRALKP